MSKKRFRPAPKVFDEEARASQAAAKERAARVAACTAELTKLLEEYRCGLQVQGQYLQPLNGGARIETVQVGVVPLGEES